MGKVAFLSQNAVARNALILFSVMIVLTHQQETHNFSNAVTDTHSATDQPAILSTGFEVKVQLQSSLSGFHRELTINVTTPTTTVVQPEKCFLLIKQTFPKDMFVDPYQIQQHFDLSHQMHMSLDVDLEKPARLAQPQIVSIFWNMMDIVTPRNSSNTITFPFHLRYQDADFHQENGNYVDVDLENPQVLLRCDDAKDLLGQTSKGQLVTRDICGPPLWSADCLWIQYHLQEGSSLRFRVPRGNLQNLPLVNIVTTTLISLACISIVITTSTGYKLTSSRKKTKKTH